MAAVETPKREVRAEAKWVRISPRKARVVATHIRGRSVPEARTVLAFTQRAAAHEIAPTLKRWRARARGRVARIRKRTCHITIVLKSAPAAPARATSARVEEEKAVEQRPKRKTTAKEKEVNA